MSLAIELYLRSPIWLQNLLVSAQGLRLRRLRYGRGQRRILAGLLKSQWHSRDEILQQQLQSLTAIVRHASTTVPLYRHHVVPTGGFSDLTSWLPSLFSKKMTCVLLRMFVVSKLHSHERLVEVHTGGTTGTPLTIYCNRNALQTNFAFFRRVRSWAGVVVGAKTATFAGRTIVAPKQNKPPFWRTNTVSNTLLFSSYHISPDTLSAYVSELQRFNPALIDSYPSSIEPIARYIQERGIETIRPVAVITSSETLSQHVRGVLQNAFACKVFDYYGGAEMAAFVSQCEAGTYHVNPEFGIVEILRDGKPAAIGEPGDIVASGFINPVMPLIRYVTGDIAAWKGNACECGRAFPALAGIEGRKDDVIVTPEGRRIGRLDPIFKSVSSIQNTGIIAGPSQPCAGSSRCPGTSARRGSVPFAWLESAWTINGGRNRSSPAD